MNHNDPLFFIDHTIIVQIDIRILNGICFATSTKLSFENKKSPKIISSELDYF
jgi:hypothetical protein